jgi:adenylate cyclase
LLRGVDDRLPGSELAEWLRVMLPVVLVIANVTGALVVSLLLGLVLPSPPGTPVGQAVVVNALAGTAYIAVAVVLGFYWGLRQFRSVERWLVAERAPDLEAQLAVLYGPGRLLAVQGVLWLAAIVAFGAINAVYSGTAARNFIATIALAGVATCAITYLLSERILRPVAARAFVKGLPSRHILTTVSVRALFAWALGTTVPVLGLLVVAIVSLVGPPLSARQFAVVILVLGLAAIVVGALATILAARATADPIRSVVDALGRVESGDLGVEVAVYDATEIGLLQAGFNRMVAGLREREEIRELFGRQVGVDVARAALGGSIELGGELRDVAVLFVDLIGSTALAADRPPHEVVSFINRVLAVVVSTVDGCGGWINKFEGDGALAVFGAPIPVADAYGRALEAARLIAHDLPLMVPGASVGIGISAGFAVAGNIGEEHRYEYTVIGDPVNEAARLTELAKTVSGRVLASETVVHGASAQESAHWTLGDTVTLRGRSQPTRLAVLRTTDEPSLTRDTPEHGSVANVAPDPLADMP